jgi:MFS family permease
MTANQNKRDFSILFLVMLITGAGNTALQSIMPALGRTMGIPDSVIATVFSVSALIWVFSAPFWARRSDRQGRRKLVLIGSAGFTISMAIVGILLLAGLSGGIPPLMVMLTVILARAIFGMFGSASPPAAQAIIVLRTPKAERTKALTLLSSAFGLGTLLGLALAPWLIFPVIGLAGPPFVFAGLGLLTWAIAAKYLSDEIEPIDRDNDARGANVSYPSLGGAPAGATVTAVTADRVQETLNLRDARIWPWMLSGITLGHAQAMTGAAMGFMVIDRLHLPVRDIITQQTIGLVLMAGAGSALLVQWGVIPRLNMQPKAMMITGLVIAVPGLVLNAFSGSLFGIATAYALSSVGFGFTRPAFTAGSSLAVGRRLQGVVAGQVTSINGSSFVLAPTIGVGLYEVWHPLPYLTAAAAILLLIPYARIKLRADKIDF